LNRLPQARDLHHWADHAELLCLADPDGMLAQGDLLERWSERAGLGEDALEPTPESLESEEDQDVDVVAATIDEDEADEPPPDSAGGTREDRMRVKADDIFRHLEYRRDTFGTAYPFELTKDLVLTRRRQMSGARRLYTFMLLASATRYVRRLSRRSLESAFERLAFEATRDWLGGAEVHPFGTTVASRGRYSGTLWAKVQRLALDLSEPLKATADDFDPNDHGDGGCDVVAWFPLGDSTSASFVAIGQATCQTNWRNKQHDSSADNWMNVIAFRVPTTNLFFVPFCFRDPTGDWYRRRWVTSVLVDRVRLMRLLGPRAGDLALPAAVDAGLAYRLAV
jgi:hypothetical protein